MRGVELQIAAYFATAWVERCGKLGGERPMLTIRGEQMLSFMPAFVAWTVDYVRTAEATVVEGWTRDEIEARVRFGGQLALSLQISNELLMLRVIVLVLELGPAFSRDSNVRAILGGSQSQQQRVDALLRDPATLDVLRQRPLATRWNDAELFS